jgi:hypothetical protein
MAGLVEGITDEDLNETIEQKVEIQNKVNQMQSRCGLNRADVDDFFTWALATERYGRCFIIF